MSLGMVVALIKNMIQKFFNDDIDTKVVNRVDYKLQDFKFSPQVNEKGNIVLQQDKTDFS